MGTLLNRRRYMGGGYSLPYDAEIEYLESTGTQYIDTGINCREIITATYSIAFSQIPTGINLIIGAFWDNPPSIPRFQFFYNNGWKDVNTTYAITTGEGIAYNVAATALKVYNVTSKSKNKYNSDSTIWIFARNNDHNDYLFASHLRFYSLSILRGGVLVRDFIPVRKGNTGYMYDKVSGQLFGNSGTGEFILGPDKT